MLLGQTNNKFACFGRLNILNMSLTPKSKDKSILLNTYALLLSTNNIEKFGHQFCKQVVDSTKPQKV